MGYGGGGADHFGGGAIMRRRGEALRGAPMQSCMAMPAPGGFSNMMMRGEEVAECEGMDEMISAPSMVQPTIAYMPTPTGQPPPSPLKQQQTPPAHSARNQHCGPTC